MFRHSLLFPLVLLSFVPTVDVHSQEDSPYSFGWSRLLNNRFVQKELELTEDQVRDSMAVVDEIADKHRAEAQELIEKWKHNQEFLTEKEEIGSANRELKESLQSRDMRMAVDFGQKIVDTLLPFQASRLEELTYWNVVNQAGYGEFVILSKVIEDKELVAELRKKNEVLQVEFEKELAQLKQKYRRKLEESLSRDQRKRLAEALGSESSLNTPIVRF